MKTLYESILDDEDELIDKSIKQVKNPFFKIKNILLQNNNKEQIIKIIKNEIDFKKDFKDFEVGVDDTSGSVYTSGGIYFYLPINKKKLYVNPYILFMQLYDDPKPKYGPFSNIDIPEKALMISFPNSTNFSENKFIKNKFGFKDGFEYKRWLIDFVKRYDLKPSKNKYIYYI